MFKTLTVSILIIGLSIQACDKGCLKCNSSNVCLFCDSTNNYYMVGSTCAVSAQTNCAILSQSGDCSQCLNNFYVDVSTNKCVAVDLTKETANCILYSSAQVCLSCSKNFFIQNGRCVAVTTLVANCESYSADGVCSACSSGYLFNVQKTGCVSSPGTANCGAYSFLACRTCANGYIENQNLYFTDLTSNIGNLLAQIQSAAYTSSSTDWTSLKSCQQVQVTNCLVAANYNTCATCQAGYFLTAQGTCQAFPNSIIDGCLAYSSLTACKQCLAGYTLQSNGNCTIIATNSLIADCQTYDGTAATVVCTSCIASKFLSGNTCSGVRVDSLNIAQCATVSANADTCSVCNSGYLLTTDSKLCLAAVAKCAAYDSSSSASTALTCNTCNSGFYLLNSNGLTTCTAGNIAGCLTYSSATVCAVCDSTGYYLNGGTCTKHVTVNNCSTYSSSAANECVKCATGYYPFKLTTLCATATVIVHCRKYSDAHTCTACASGYLLVGNACQKLSVLANCQLDDGKGSCTTCLSGFIIQTGGVCVDRGVVLHCTTFDANGVCTACYTGYLQQPNGVCVAQSTVPNCIAIANNGTCTACNTGYLIEPSGACVAQTSVPNCQTVDNTGTCTACADTYFLRNDNICVLASTVPNCATATGNASGGSDCVTCNVGYILNTSNACILLNTILKCTAYTDASTCSGCATGFTLTSNQCLRPSSLSNCSQEDGNTQCVICSTGYVVNQGACQVKSNTPNCNIDDGSTSTTAGYVAPCVQCESTYILRVDGGCVLQTTVGPNCVLADNDNNCKTCATNYLLRDDFQCILASLVPNCTEVSYTNSANVCVTCIPNAFVVSGACVVATAVSGCSVYSSLTACTTCGTTYLQQSSTACVLKTLRPNCTALDSTGACTTCDDSYILRSDKTCISSTVIPGCTQISFTNNANYCDACDSELFLTIPGGSGCLFALSKPGCTAVNASQVCTACATGYLQQPNGGCVSTGSVPNCASIDNTGACLTCNTGALLTADAYCVLQTAVPNCTAVNTTNGGTPYICTACATNYFINNGQCASPLSIPNCASYSSYSLCSKCITGYDLLNNACNVLFDYITADCQTLSTTLVTTGWSDPDTSNCVACKSGSESFSLGQIYTCVRDDLLFVKNTAGFSFLLGLPLPGLDATPTPLVTNCKRYSGYNSPTCYECISPMKLLITNGVYSCVADCDYTQQTHVDFTSDMHINVCANYTDSSNGGETNCAEATYFRGYSCISAAAGYLNQVTRIVPSDYYIVNRIDPAYSARQPSSALFYRGFDITPITDSTLGSTASKANCELFALDTNNKAYCYRCAWGMASTVTLVPAAGSASAYTQSSCSTISNCVTTQYFGGFSALLNQLLSCHMCDSGYVLLVTVASGFSTSGLGGTIDTSRNLDIAGLRAGIPSVQCLANSDYTSLPGAGAIIPNCQVYVRSGDVTVAGTWGSSNVVEGCVACAPGYAPVTNSTTGSLIFNSCEQIADCASGSSGVMVNRCDTCSQVDASNQPVNRAFASFEGYYDLQSCVQVNTPNCFIAAYGEDVTTYNCEYCNPGYVLNADNICSTYTFPDCADTAVTVTNAGSALYIGENAYYYLLKLSNQTTVSGCNQCNTGYTAMSMPYGESQCVASSYVAANTFPSNTQYIPNCDNYANTQSFEGSAPPSCVTCKTGFVPYNNLCHPKSNVANCYVDDESTSTTPGYTPPCIQCNDNYILRQDASCVLLSSVTPNCILADNTNKCAYCADGFYLKSDNTCSDNTSKPNCAATNSSDVCNACKANYLLRTDNLCIAQSDVPDCTAIDVSAGSSVCTACDKNHFVVSGACQGATSVTGCDVYSSLTACSTCLSTYFQQSSTVCVDKSTRLNCTAINSTGLCTTCQDGYILRSDASCIATSVIPGCTQINLELIFNYCAACDTTTYLWIPDGTGCVLKTTLPNCITINSTKACTACDTAYLIEPNGNCVLASTKPNCATIDNNGVCLTCNANSLLSTDGYCLANTDVPNCTTASTTAGAKPYICTACAKNFFVQSNACVAPPTISNCANYSDINTCSSCATGYYLSGNACSLIVHDYIADYCDSPAIPAAAPDWSTPNSSACTTCKASSEPVALGGLYACVNNDLLFSKNITAAVLNADGSVATAGTVVTGCKRYGDISGSPTCFECTGTQLLRIASTGYSCVSQCDNTAETYQEDMLDGRVKACVAWSLGDYGVNNCADAAAIWPGSSLRNYCVGAGNGLLNTLDTAYEYDDQPYYYREGSFSTVPKPAGAFLYNGYDVDPLDTTHLSTTDSQTNCELFITYNSKLHCYRCVWGSASTVSAVTVGGSNLKSSTCQSIQYCDTTTYYGGFSSTLNMALSCHQCQNGLALLLTVESTFTASVKNLLEVTGLHIGIPSLQCVAATGNSDLPNNAAIPNCLVHVKSGDNTVAAWTSSNVIQGCAACAPGYQPVLTSSEKIFNSCTQIANCDANTKNVMANRCNACSQVDAANNPVYRAFATSALQSCIQVTSSNCFIADTTKVNNINVCKFCMPGYMMNADGTCSAYTAPECSTPIMNFESLASPTSTDDIGIYHMLRKLAGRTNLRGCDSCSTGFTALVMPAGELQCVESDYIGSDTFPATTVYVRYCQKYADTIATSGTTRYTCSTCISGYILIGASCLPQIGIPFSARRLLAARRLATQLATANCVTWETTPSVGTQELCTGCASGYYLTASKTCALGSVNFCNTYANNSPLQCTACLANYNLINTANGMTYCIQINASSNCVSMLEGSQGLQNDVFQCTSCYADDTVAYFSQAYSSLSNQSTLPQSVCLALNPVNNCAAYDSANASVASNSFLCIGCNSGFYLHTNTNTCVARTNQPAGCVLYYVAADKCQTCSDSTYKSADETDCVSFPTGILGCATYTNTTVCASCTAPRYLSSNACLVSTVINNCVAYSANYTCSACNTNYFLTNSTYCQPATATGCYTLSSVTACASCDPSNSNKGLKTASDGSVNCVDKNVANCVVSTNQYPFQCTQCQTGYYPDSNGVCQAATVINMCAVYDSATTCTACNTGAVLTVDRTACNNTYFAAVTDQSCTNVQLLGTPTCSVCAPGYIFANNTCTMCANNTQADGCYSCDPNNQTSCLACRPGYFQSSNGACQIYGLSAQNDTTVKASATIVKLLGSLVALLMILL